MPTTRAQARGGQLLQMCSAREAREREECLEVNVLEQPAGAHASSVRRTIDVTRAVKKYKRPEAGAPPRPPSELRPLSVLRATVEYLLRLWHGRADVSPLSRYLFLSDRLRAVQQDLTVQQLHCPALLARIVRFHLLMELEFCALPLAAEAGYSSVHNRTLLCNALISALERPAECPARLHAELLGYFVLLHANLPNAPLLFHSELARASPSVAASPRVRRALAIAAALARDDAAGLRRALSSAPLLEVAAVLRLLPIMRGAALAGCNAAYAAREDFPLRALQRLLWLRSPDEARRCAEAHGLAIAPADGSGADGGADGGGGGGSSDGSLHFHAAGFKREAAAIEPPLLPPPLAAVERWREREGRGGGADGGADGGGQDWSFRLLCSGEEATAGA